MSRAVIDNARQERLQKGLQSIALWCNNRTSSGHNSETTLTMLEKKASELRGKVDKAGYNAINNKTDKGKKTFVINR